MCWNMSYWDVLKYAILDVLKYVILDMLKYVIFHMLKYVILDMLIKPKRNRNLPAMPMIQ